MKKLITATLLSLAFLFQASAREQPDVKHHTVEISITPAVSSHFVTWPGRSPGYKLMVNNLYRPLMAFNFGLAYIYRPIRLFGISTGFDEIEYLVKKMGQIDPDVVLTPGGPLTTVARFSGYEAEGYIGVPVLLHFYQSINKLEVELSTGPEFLFPVFYISNYSETFSNAVFSPEKFHTTRYYNASEMREYSWLAWSAQLTADLPIKNIMLLTVGPEWKFLTIHPLDTGPHYNLQSHEIDFYIGVKVGIRLGSNFYRTAKTPKG